jgi:hypothetical protein
MRAIRRFGPLALALFILGAPLVAAPPEPPPTPPTAEPAAPAVLEASPAAPAAELLPWELPAPVELSNWCFHDGDCWVCYDHNGRCDTISCPWGDFNC